VEEEEADQQIQKLVALRLFDEPTMPIPNPFRDSIPIISGPITKPTEIKTVR
jgi:hypothetical protein